jgi:hypothetical protein
MITQIIVIVCSVVSVISAVGTIEYIKTGASIPAITGMSMLCAGSLTFGITTGILNTGGL